MKKILTFCALALLAFHLQAQTNLVPNGDFEQYNDCPIYCHQFNTCDSWINPTDPFAGGGSPDYFNRCSNQNAGVPLNNAGYQETHSGNGYVGIVIYSHENFISNYREYIEVPLKIELEQNVCYHYSMYVCLSKRSKFSSNNIGAFFADSVIYGINCYNPLPVVPQINNTNIILPDTLSWSLIEGDIVAHGNERFLIIGNFKNDNSTNTVLVNSNGIWESVYLYIDDVSLYKCNSSIYSANAGEDVDLCKGKTTTLKMQSLPEYKYRWYSLSAGNNTLMDSVNSIEVSPMLTTSYALWVRDFKYEESWDTVTVFVMEDCDNELEIPNVFTPNADGFNDEFVIKGKNIQEINVQIFNRYSKKIAELTEPLQTWDGTQNNGQKSDEGVYFWTAVINFRNGEKLNTQGTITLLR